MSAQRIAALAELDKADQRQRREYKRRTLQVVHDELDNGRAINDVTRIPDDLWNRAEKGELDDDEDQDVELEPWSVAESVALGHMWYYGASGVYSLRLTAEQTGGDQIIIGPSFAEAGRTWTPVLRDRMTQVQRLVHRQCRMSHRAKLAERLHTQRLDAYRNELEIVARRAGCDQVRAHETARPELRALSDRDSGSIIQSYNYDLGLAIIRIGEAIPSANRNTYKARLRVWSQERAAYKEPQIAEYTESSARAMAQADFVTSNSIQGVADIQPRRAVCPVCAGWIARVAQEGFLPLRVVMADPGPYHPNCPHRWIVYPHQVARADCGKLWMGDPASYGPRPQRRFH